MALDWTAAGFDLEPVAKRTGPFPRRQFLETWWDLRSEGEPLIVSDAEGLLALERVGSIVRFMGEPDLTDYHSPLGNPTSVVETLVEDAGLDLHLDSLPLEAATPLRDALGAAGLRPTLEAHAVTAIIDLPETTDVWLAGLAKKQRHELRRKMRRFRAEAGEPVIARANDSEALATFVELHRMASGDKGAFMDEEMATWFAALIDRAGAFCDILTGDEGRPLAAAVGFADAGSYYLYNSAYDPALAHLSAGIVLLAVLISQSIAAGLTRFDFLKGAEPYKFQLGAVARELFELRMTS